MPSVGDEVRITAVHELSADLDGEVIHLQKGQVFDLTLRNDRQRFILHALESSGFVSVEVKAQAQQ